MRTYALLFSGLLLSGMCGVSAHAEDILTPDMPQALEQASIVSDDVLSETRGTGGLSNDAQLFALSQGNSAINTVTGANIISDSAFSNFQGNATVIQNSGNNVVLQNSTIINLSLSK